MSDGALDGLVVIDLTTGAFGYAGRLLAGFGAQVTKVEPPGGDPIRHTPPYFQDQPGEDRGGRHFYMNGGKQSVVLDLDTPEAIGTLQSLISGADVLIESLPPGFLAARGLGYEEMAREHSRLVVASITHFGQEGPYADCSGSEIVVGALGGYLMLTGDSDREPVKPYDDLVEQQAALHAAVGVMAALTRRDETGEGDYLDVSAQDAAAFLLGGLAQVHHATGATPRRRGTRLLFDEPSAPYPSTVRPCKDGHVHVHTNVRNPDLLATLVGNDLLSSSEFLSEPMGHADEYDAAIDPWLAQFDKAEVVRRAQELRLPFTEVFTPAELLQDRHLKERGFFSVVDEPAVGPVRVPGPPFVMAETPWRVARAPMLGEHDA